MKRLQVGLIASLLSLSSMAFADTLMLDVIKEAPANSKEGLLRPTKGMSEKQVLKVFGEPVSKTSEVGYPPISSWKYDKFTVYFEFEFVVTSVVDRE